MYQMQNYTKYHQIALRTKCEPAHTQRRHGVEFGNNTGTQWRKNIHLNENVSEGDRTANTEMYVRQHSIVNLCLFCYSYSQQRFGYTCSRTYAHTHPCSHTPAFKQRKGHTARTVQCKSKWCNSNEWRTNKSTFNSQMEWHAHTTATTTTQRRHTCYLDARKLIRSPR